jgi:exopolysaccharide biosynthesis protein
MVVVDGRQPLSSMGATLPDMAEIFRRLGAADALNLDGGGSTAMVVAGDAGPQVLNTPIHTGVPGRERPSANQLGVRAK